MATQNGEFTLTLGGTVYTFKLGTAALGELQELFATADGAPSIQELVKHAMSGRVKYVQAFLWAGLRKHHREVSLDQVADLLDEADEGEVRALLARMGITTQPDPADLADLGLDKPNPPVAQAVPSSAKARRGGGGRSTSAPVAAV